MTMKKYILVLAAILMVSAPLLQAQDGSFRIEGMVNYFQPSEDAFKDIYGSGMTYGGEIGIRIMDWLSLWAGADFYNQTGELTFTGEETELQIIPVYGGLMFELPNQQFHPYAALGVGYFQYKEENPIGSVDGGELGYIVQAGVRITVVSSLFFDIKGSYSICKTQPADFEIELGGIKGGIGIGFEF